MIPKVRVVYIAGPFRATNAWEIEQNIRCAEELALAVWQRGAAALCPHTNARFFSGAADDNVFLQGDLELLSRCDAVLMTPNWTHSHGACAEHSFACAHNIPVFYHIDVLERWLLKQDS